MNNSGENNQAFDSIKELLSLRENKILSIPKIEWWLLKFSELYKKLNPETLETFDTLDFHLPDRVTLPKKN